MLHASMSSKSVPPSKVLARFKDISVHLIIRTAGALVNLLLEFLAAPVLRSVIGEEAERRKL